MIILIAQIWPISQILEISNSFAFFRQQQETGEYRQSDLVLRYIDPDYRNISQP